MSFSYGEWSAAGWRTHAPELADVTALGDDTISALAAASAARVPDRVAVSIDGLAVTHAALDDGAARVAGWLAPRLRPGDRVLLAAGASQGFLRCYLGSLRAGAVVVLANPGYTTAELAHLAADSGAVLAFADQPRVAGLPTMNVRSVPDRPPAGIAADPYDAEPDDIALLGYTSGTTGKPKGVPLTHRQLLISTRAAMAAWRWSADDVLAHALPLFHQHGLSGVHMALISGGSASIMSAFSPAGLIDTIRVSQASVLFGVPTIYQSLLEAGTVVPRELRLAVCGSAPLSPALAERLPDILGQLPLVRYGTTESGLNVSNPIGDPRGGSVGVPLPGVQARVRDLSAGPLSAGTDAATGTDAAPGTDGEIQLRGAQVFGGYWHDPAATAAAFTADGWFRTGDIGTIREDASTGEGSTGEGHLVIRGRIKEMIITGGLNVYPREVEIALEAHPSVLEAAVAGLPDEHWGEQVTAWVVPREGHAFDEAGLIAHARTLLAAYKCPKQVFALAALPRNQVGKVLRGDLPRQ
jgi:acyl-CoA synthetase (AMP-forming)/AMP-acid ligase II